jgi:succinyl-CoA synthetase beta subunit
MIGMTLITHQTGPEGRHVKRVLVEKGCNIEKEYYVLSRRPRHLQGDADGLGRGRHGHRGSGRQDAGKDPQSVIRSSAWRPFRRARSPSSTGWVPMQVKQAASLCMNLYKMPSSRKTARCRDQPLVLTGRGSHVLDAKLNFDDNALFRHRVIRDMRDYDEEDPNEIEASQYDLSYIAARRQHRLPGQRCGSRHGHDGHHQALRRRARQLSRRGRRRDHRAVTEAFKIILSDDRSRASWSTSSAAS